MRSVWVCGFRRIAQGDPPAVAGGATSRGGGGAACCWGCVVLGAAPGGGASLPGPGGEVQRLALLAPGVLSLHFLLFLRCEVVLNVEPQPNFLWRFALDLVRHSLAREVEERLDVEVVGGEDQVEERLIVHLDEVLVPVGLLILRHRGLRGVVVFAVLYHLNQDLRVNHRQRHGRVRASVLDHVLHSHRAARHIALDLEDLLLLRLQLDEGGNLGVVVGHDSLVSERRRQSVAQSKV
mmetsp:Transcript_32447/g.75782  ORF Transcript_32447/g.75782 Transcript_32447/m.75782 type:complete len:237 (+) Transcript_32447:249-959(+)